MKPSRRNLRNTLAKAERLSQGAPTLSRYARKRMAALSASPSVRDPQTEERSPMK